MKEKILAALKTKFVGVPDAILDRIATQKAKTVTTEDQITPLVEGLTLQNVFDSYGDSRATEASQTAVSNYEKKHNLKDGKLGADTEPTPQPPANPQPAAGLTLEDVTKAVAAAMKPFAEKVTQFEQQTVAEKRNAEILAKAKEYGVPESQAKRYSIPQDADLDVYMKEVAQDLANDGFANARSPEGGGDTKSESENIAAQINQGTKEIVESKK